MSYTEFLSRKLAHVPASGFAAQVTGRHLFDYQRDLVRWALMRASALGFVLGVLVGVSHLTGDTAP